MSFPTSPDAQIPHIAINKDLENFVYAVSKLQPGKSYMVEGTTCSWSESLRIWSEITRVPASYKQVSLAEYVDATPDKEPGREVWDMWDYCTDLGYDGGDSTSWKAPDIRKVCIYPCLLEFSLI